MHEGQQACGIARVGHCGDQHILLPAVHTPLPTELRALDAHARLETETSEQLSLYLRRYLRHRRRGQ